MQQGETSQLSSGIKFLKSGEDKDSLPKYNYGNGFGWRSAKERKERKGNQTPGNVKCDTCRASPTDKWMAKTSRSYKHRGYSTWFNKTRKTANE